MPEPAAQPDPRTCEQVRLSRYPRFDGLVFTAVATTGIDCRPVCPAPPPKPANVRYFANASAAQAAGYRPCLRCRPELSPEDGSWRRGDAVVARALKLIEQGLLANVPLEALAARVHVGERQLRRLFVERLGAPPIGVHGTRRLWFPRQLLTETALPVTEVAMAAGFGSLRRFNDGFRAAYGMAPRDLRKRESRADSDALVLRLGYRPPYDFAAMFDFLRGRALPAVEQVDEHGYHVVHTVVARLQGFLVATHGVGVPARHRCAPVSGHWLRRRVLHGLFRKDRPSCMGGRRAWSKACAGISVRRLETIFPGPRAASAGSGRMVVRGPGRKGEMRSATIRVPLPVKIAHQCDHGSC